MHICFIRHVDFVAIHHSIITLMNHKVILSPKILETYNFIKSRSRLFDDEDPSMATRSSQSLDPENECKKSNELVDVDRPVDGPDYLSCCVCLR